jgi:hypothetical protein
VRSGGPIILIGDCCVYAGEIGIYRIGEWLITGSGRVKAVELLTEMLRFMGTEERALLSGEGFLKGGLLSVKLVWLVSCATDGLRMTLSRLG